MIGKSPFGIGFVFQTKINLIQFLNNYINNEKRHYYYYRASEMCGLNCAVEKRKKKR